MTSHDRALLLLRELLQTPSEELVHFPRRAGLHTQPTPDELERAQGLVGALVVALESERGSAAWQRVHDAWVGSRQRLGAPPTPGLVDPPPPAWIGNLPAMPSLGDPAPGTAEAEGLEQQRNRFVPQAPPTYSAPTGPTFDTPAFDALGAPPMRRAQTPPTPPLTPRAELLAADARTAAPSPGQHLPGWARPQPGAPSAATTAGVYGEAYAIGPAAASPSPPPQAPRVGPPPLPTAAARGLAGAAPSLPPPRPSLGFDPASWTVSRYAALCAACSASPQRAGDTAREYGVPDEHARRSLDDHFAERFDRDPTEQEQWERLVVQFRERLRSPRG
ncbi:MAG: hypothetical protein FJ096_00805 [Deltaproteobacteria bacterium]|nr:hypothetical protein [Deltaproteobacteria bacterium]